MIQKLTSIGTGSWLALLCAIHCALTPILLSTSPILVGQWLHNEWFEWGMLGLSAVLGLYPLYKGFIRHQNLKPFFRMSIALSIFLLSLVCLHHTEWLGTTANFMGAGWMISAQSLNSQYLKGCACKH